MHFVFRLWGMLALAGGVAEEWDERVAVPEVAATVYTCDVLQYFNIEVAAMMREPRKVLLPSRRGPFKLEHPLSSLGRGHSSLMRRARKSGLDT